MNYRHAYHAGNAADCVKHALLLELVRAMQRKPKPFLMLDTHAGTGMYDLATGPAARTGEWRSGIGRLVAGRPAALADYLSLVERLGLYPGSPALAAAVLREGDRLVCCELHPEDAGLLKAQFLGVKGVAVHQRDGYAALRAFLPPAEKRALVLIDPPYEREDELEVARAALAAAYAKCPAGVYVLWYPVKTLAPLRDFFTGLSHGKLRDVVNAQLLWRAPVDPTRLNGCGLMIVNPPYGFEPAAMAVLQTLCEVLGEAQAACSYERLIDE